MIRAPITRSHPTDHTRGPVSPSERAFHTGHLAWPSPGSQDLDLATRSRLPDPGNPQAGATSGDAGRAGLVNDLGYGAERSDGPQPFDRVGSGDDVAADLAEA